MIDQDSGHVYGGILLDHDLQLQQRIDSDRDVSGSQVVDSIISNISKQMPILIHSMNPGQAPAMVHKLESAGFSAISRVSWYEMNVTIYHEWLEEVREAWPEKDE